MLALTGGAALAITHLMRPRQRRELSYAGELADHALSSYLLDHLSGSDAAFAVVKRLRKSHAGTSEGRLFQELYDEFRQDREVIRTLLAALGERPLSVKRAIGQATGTLAKFAAGGKPGDLALFRTLESLAIGVQGKRLLWRALGEQLPSLEPLIQRTFADLELRAIDEWQRIEKCRLALVPATFDAAVRAR